MDKRNIIIRFVIVLAAHFALAIPTITDVTAQQRYPWNGMVDISYTASGNIGAMARLQGLVPSLRVTATDGDTGTAYTATSLSGDVSLVDGTHSIVWDARADLGEVHFTNMVMNVSFVMRGKVQLWDGGPYWATMNIGAEEPEEYGLYFWWGDTIGYRRENGAWKASNGSSTNFSFSSGNTPTYNKSPSTLQSEGWITIDNVLAPEHDAAHIQWGGSWRMPTDQELSDLNNNCDWIWTTMNNVNGYVVRGRDGYASASIFLPAAGCDHKSSFSFAGMSGLYWSSTPSPGSYDSWTLNFGSGSHRTSRYYSRYDGQSIRPVLEFTK